MLKKETTNTLLELANHYPSPHNGQPIRVKLVDGNHWELYFERERGLQSADISFIFSFVTMGVFAEHLRLCATALGHEAEIALNLPKEPELKGNGPVLFGRVVLRWNVQTPDMRLRETLETRQTSRKKYYEQPDEKTAGLLVRTAADAAMRLVKLSGEQTRQAIWLNQRAVFDDMFNERVRQELDHWLRYSAKEKESSKDGLSYDCMELNGRLLKYIVAHPGILRWSGVAWALRHYYLRTMMDSSSVFYMLAPFGNEQAAYNIGEVVMRIWKRATEAGYFLHPFGTIVSNPKAHKDFLQLVDVHNESRKENYLVFIFRAGRSEQPAKSLRLPYEQHLIME